MRPRVQWSNARRIGFTALAVVAFWLLAWWGYRVGRDGHGDVAFFRDETGGFFTSDRAAYCVVIAGVALLIALLPTLLLLVSSPRRRRKRFEPWIWLSGLGFACAGGYCFRLGFPHTDTIGMPHRYLANLEQEAGPFHVWFFLPILLTTAFVIFYAWRSARSSQVVEAGRDEDVVLPHVQVSNSRRVGFTMLALVAFWLITFEVYGIFDARWGLEAYLEPKLVSFDDSGLEPPWLVAAAVLAFTLLPTAFVFLSASHSPAGLRHPHVLVCAALFAGTIWLSYWIGQHNVMPASTMREWIEMVDAHPGEDGSDESIAEVRALHHVSWIWLLLPIVLTTAFVILGAWRSAVQGSAVQAELADEGE